MALLGLFRKKKKFDLDLPPPPSAEPEELSDVSGIPDIRVGAELPPPPVLKSKSKRPELPPEIPVNLPEFPSMPSEEQEYEDRVPSPKTELELAVESPVESDLRKVSDENIVFDKTVRPVSEQTVEVVHKTPVRKTFISVDDYSAITDSCEIVRSKMADAEMLIRKINELKVEENKAVDAWLVHLEEIEKKLAHADKILAKAQS